mmetsp:Transcript_79008/g.209810  ORF Transcript_79008/g.209810 Transcript_79008/m.209810 type:complete len:429 (+) Transcript_79008:360-1646(+)
MRAPPAHLRRRLLRGPGHASSRRPLLLGPCPEQLQQIQDLAVRGLGDDRAGLLPARHGALAALLEVRKVCGLDFEQRQHDADLLAEGHPLQGLTVALVEAHRPLRVGHVAEAAVAVVDALAHGEVDAGPRAEVRVSDAAWVPCLRQGLAGALPRVPEHLRAEELVGDDLVREAVGHGVPTLDDRHGLVALRLLGQPVAELVGQVLEPTPSIVGHFPGRQRRVEVHYVVDGGAAKGLHHLRACRLLHGGHRGVEVAHGMRAALLDCCEDGVARLRRDAPQLLDQVLRVVAAFLVQRAELLRHLPHAIASRCLGLLDSSLQEVVNHGGYHLQVPDHLLPVLCGVAGPDDRLQRCDLALDPIDDVARHFGHALPHPLRDLADGGQRGGEPLLVVPPARRHLLGRLVHLLPQVLALEVRVVAGVAQLPVGDV